MRTKYTGLQIGIHWLVFLLVIVAYCAMEFRLLSAYRPTADQYDPRLMRDRYPIDGNTSAGAPEVPRAAD